MGVEWMRGVQGAESVCSGDTLTHRAADMRIPSAMGLECVHLLQKSVEKIQRRTDRWMGHSIRWNQEV
jgi:hypothetical protein